ncbi:RmlC-like cupin domain-containing protein [Amylostereum chailletii]|nr:RmlC-like cupin domain-containing protein [Amylostereum chailletii]
MDYSTCPPTAELIHDLSLIKHPEGGYFAETDRQTEQIPSPFAGGEPRSLATSIFYLLSSDSPNGFIHMNKSATMHVHHHGRAEYTLITPRASPADPPKVERVIVGPNAAAGEKRQLLVGTSVWKMSRLLQEDIKTAEPARLGCLIIEVVFPGFHWEDHKYLTKEGLDGLFEGTEDADRWTKELSPYVKK